MRRTSALLAVLSLVFLAAACGQKPGVSDSTQTVAGGGGGSTADGFSSSDGTGADGGVAVGGDGGGSGATGGGGGGTSGGGTGGTGGGTGGTGGGAGGTGGSTGGGGGGGGAAAGPGDRTGYTDKVIKIGVHAPITGAAPVPQESFRQALPLYWEFVKRTQGGVFGRDVEIVFRDDQFDPSRAVQVCRELVEQEKVFILVGAAGGDQITACAKYANSVGVPYFSPGVNEEGLENLRGYFAVSQTYTQQAPIVAQMSTKISQAKKVGIIHEDTPTFKGSRSVIRAEFEKNGFEVVYDELISKGASQAEILTTSNQLRNSGADVVYFLGPPATFAPLAQQGQGQGYTPAYVGPGLSQGLNLVATAGCPGMQNAQYLSPFPQLDVIDQFDPDYRREYREQTGEEADDLGIGIWGLEKMSHQMFLAAGENMSRQSLIQVLESGKRFETKVFPPVQYKAGSGGHFGAGASNILKVDCGSRTWKTIAPFVSRG